MSTVIILNDKAIVNCKCGSLFRHFHLHSDQWIIWCAEKSCERVALVGKLVLINGEPKDKMFVVPFCFHHANSVGGLDIGDVKPISSLACKVTI